MLDLCLDYLKERMNQSVKHVFDLAEDLVMVIFVSNIEKDGFSKNYRPEFSHTSNRKSISSQPLHEYYNANSEELAPFDLIPDRETACLLRQYRILLKSARGFTQLIADAEQFSAYSPSRCQSSTSP
ncbi:hypothetical protein [Erwinia sp. MYb416]|uniref:hypothetical protein n=1 Tax=Erwinia sp. MYb416 TaxID=3108532 RepID=UPI0030AF1BA2